MDSAKGFAGKQILLLLLAVWLLTCCSQASAAGKDAMTPLPKKAEVYLKWQLFQGETPPWPVATVEKEKGKSDRVIITGVAAWGVSEKSMTLYQWSDQNGWKVPKEWKNKTLDDQIILVNPVEILNGNDHSIGIDINIIFDLNDTGLTVKQLQIGADNGLYVVKADGTFYLVYQGKSWDMTADYDREGQLVSADYKSKDIVWIYSRLSRVQRRYGLSSIAATDGKGMGLDWLWDSKEGWSDTPAARKAKKNKKINPEKLPFVIVGDPEPDTDPSLNTRGGFLPLAGETFIPVIWPGEDLSQRDPPYEVLPDGTLYDFSDYEGLYLSVWYSDTHNVVAYYNEYYDLIKYRVGVFDDSRGGYRYTYHYYPDKDAQMTEPKLLEAELIDAAGDSIYYLLNSRSSTGWYRVYPETGAMEEIEPPWFAELCLPLELR